MDTESTKEEAAELATSEEVLVLDENFYDSLISEAYQSSRERALKTLHKPWEHANKMINAILPESYIRPHKHKSPHHSEVFSVLKGEAELIFFEEDGKVSERVLMAKKRRKKLKSYLKNVPA